MLFLLFHFDYLDIYRWTIWRNGSLLNAWNNDLLIRRQRE